MIVTAATGVQQDLATVTPREVATVTAAATIATATARSADRDLAISQTGRRVRISDRRARMKATAGVETENSYRSVIRETTIDLRAKNATATGALCVLAPPPPSRRRMMVTLREA